MKDKILNVVIHKEVSSVCDDTIKHITINNNKNKSKLKMQLKL